MKKGRLCSIVVIILFLLGCTTSNGVSEREMNEMGAALIKLSSSVESTVRYKAVGTDVPDDQLLILATKHDPSLLEPFKGYKLHVMKQDNHAAVLVCSGDGRNALLEDAGCTARMDLHRWREKPLSPCEFTIDLKSACSGSK